MTGTPEILCPAYYHPGMACVGIGDAPSTLINAGGSGLGICQVGKGVSSNSVIWKHAFGNSLIPPLTYAVLILAGFISGTVVTETVFAWPGLGLMVCNAIINIDFPVVTAAVMVGTLLTMAGSFGYQHQAATSPALIVNRHITP